MLDFSDAPYRFFPSRPSRPVIALSRWANRTFILPGPNHRIDQLTITGHTDKLAALRQRHDTRLLFVANHPSHSDPQTMVEIQRRLGVTTCFMAAYDVFLRSRFNAWVMQRNGAFSIDREAADRKSMTEAGAILARGNHGLTVFPEGNVHFTNDRVTPFLEGASFIAVRTQKSLGEAADVIAVPVSLKFSNLENVRPQLLASLAATATALGDNLDPAAPPVDELVRIGRKLLARNLSQRGYLSTGEHPDPDPDCIFETLQRSAADIVDGLEPKMGLPPQPSASIHDRVKRIRTTIHQILSDPAREIDHRPARSLADEALLVLRILGYGVPYVRDNPTLDRFSETVEKLNEDLHNRHSKPAGARSATAHIGTPISVRELLADPAKPRATMAALNSTLEATIQTGIDTINTHLDTEGSKPS